VLIHHIRFSVVQSPTRPPTSAPTPVPAPLIIINRYRYSSQRGVNLMNDDDALRIESLTPPSLTVAYNWSTPNATLLPCLSTAGPFFSVSSSCLLMGPRYSVQLWVGRSDGIRAYGQVSQPLTR
jgi:hypothetical protein